MSTTVISIQGSNTGMGHVILARVASRKCSERSRLGNPYDACGPLRIDACQPNRTLALLPRRKQKADKRTRDVILQSMADANEELSVPIRDVNKLRPATHEKKTAYWQDHDLLTCAIHCAAKQYLLQTELKNLVLVDELTDLQRSSISLGVGVAKFVPSNPIPLSELMVQADKAMYLQKISRSQSVVPERAFRHAPAAVN